VSAVQAQDKEDHGAIMIVEGPGFYDQN
jgi:hypothetical protein